MSKYVTQNHRNLQMYNQNNRPSDTLKCLLSLFLLILTSCFGLFNKFVHRYRTAFSLFLQKTQIFLSNEIKKSPYRFVTYLHPENSNGRCSGTILTGNICVTVLVIRAGWSILCLHCVKNIKKENVRVYFSMDIR